MKAFKSALRPGGSEDDERLYQTSGEKRAVTPKKQRKSSVDGHTSPYSSPSRAGRTESLSSANPSRDAGGVAKPYNLSEKPTNTSTTGPAITDTTAADTTTAETTTAGTTAAATTRTVADPEKVEAQQSSTMVPVTSTQKHEDSTTSSARPTETVVAGGESYSSSTNKTSRRDRIVESSGDRAADQYGYHAETSGQAPVSSLPQQDTSRQQQTATTSTKEQSLSESAAAAMAYLASSDQSGKGRTSKSKAARPSSRASGTSGYESTRSVASDNIVRGAYGSSAKQYSMPGGGSRNVSGGEPSQERGSRLKEELNTEMDTTGTRTTIEAEKPAKKKKDRKGGLFGFLSRDKKPKEEKEKDRKEKEQLKKDKFETSPVVSTSAQVAPKSTKADPEPALTKEEPATKNDETLHGKEGVAVAAATTAAAGAAYEGGSKDRRVDESQTKTAEPTSSTTQTTSDTPKVSNSTAPAQPLAVDTSGSRSIESTGATAAGPHSADAEPGSPIKALANAPKSEIGTGQPGGPVKDLASRKSSFGGFFSRKQSRGPHSTATANRLDPSVGETTDTENDIPGAFPASEQADSDADASKPAAESAEKPSGSEYTTGTSGAAITETSEPAAQSTDRTAPGADLVADVPAAAAPTEDRSLPTDVSDSRATETSSVPAAAVLAAPAPQEAYTRDDTYHTGTELSPVKETGLSSEQSPVTPLGPKTTTDLDVTESNREVTEKDSQPGPDDSKWKTGAVTAGIGGTAAAVAAIVASKAHGDSDKKNKSTGSTEPAEEQLPKETEQDVGGNDKRRSGVFGFLSRDKSKDSSEDAKNKEKERRSEDQNQAVLAEQKKSNAKDEAAAAKEQKEREKAKEKEEKKQQEKAEAAAAKEKKKHEKAREKEEKKQREKEEKKQQKIAAKQEKEQKKAEQKREKEEAKKRKSMDAKAAATSSQQRTTSSSSSSSSDKGHGAAGAATGAAVLGAGGVGAVAAAESRDKDAEPAGETSQTAVTTSHPAALGDNREAEPERPVSAIDPEEEPHTKEAPAVTQDTQENRSPVSSLHESSGVAAVPVVGGTSHEDQTTAPDTTQQELAPAPVAPVAEDKAVAPHTTTESTAEQPEGDRERNVPAVAAAPIPVSTSPAPESQEQVHDNQKKEDKAAGSSSSKAEKEKKKKHRFSSLLRRKDRDSKSKERDDVSEDRTRESTPLPVVAGDHDNETRQTEEQPQRTHEPESSVVTQDKEKEVSHEEPSHDATGEDEQTADQHEGEEGGEGEHHLGSLMARKDTRKKLHKSPPPKVAEALASEHQTGESTGETAPAASTET